MSTDDVMAALPYLLPILVTGIIIALAVCLIIYLTISAIVYICESLEKLYYHLWYKNYKKKENHHVNK